jgi:hypothetical protein
MMSNVEVFTCKAGILLCCRNNFNLRNMLNIPGALIVRAKVTTTFRADFDLKKSDEQDIGQVSTVGFLVKARSSSSGR